MNITPFTKDRAIPLYLGLAQFLEHLDVPEHEGRRRKTKSNQLHGVKRALLLQQLHHRLWDSQVGYSRRLIMVDDRRYFLAKYEYWARFELPILTEVQIRLEFRALIASGYVVANEPPGENGRKALTINYELLERNMRADERFRELTAIFSSPGERDQSIAPRDRAIESAIERSRIGSFDRAYTESESEKTLVDNLESSKQIESSSSSTADEKLPNGKNLRFDYEEGATRNSRDDYKSIYFKLMEQGIQGTARSELAKWRSIELVESWCNPAAKAKAEEREKRRGKPIDNWPGFLINSLKQFFPAPNIASADDDNPMSYVTGKYADEIEH